MKDQMRGPSSLPFRGVQHRTIWLIATSFCVTDIAALRGEDGPPSPYKAWSPPQLREYERHLALGDIGKKDHTRQIDPEKVYELSELIDIAERTNPRTRIAWERARQAAAEVGVTQSSYFPYLVASAGAGYERAFIPFPSLRQGPGPSDVSIVGGGTVVTRAAMEQLALDVKWLLFDFGEREAVTTMAKEGLIVANVGFNAVHQQIVFAVTRHYYELNTARRKIEVSESSAHAADTVARSVRARFEHGLATRPELLQAEQQSAQAAFDLVAAQGSMSDAQVALVESLGILPTAKLQVARVSEKPFPQNSPEAADELIARGLSQRPDLVAKFAIVQANRAGVQKARAAFYPRIALGAQAGWAELDVSVKDSRYFGGNEPNYGARLFLEFPLFDGFARRNRLRSAEAALRAAESELEGSRDTVIREVWKARTDFETALRKRESAAKLVAAAENAFSASLDAYRQGVGTYVEVASAQRNNTAAHSVMVDTNSAIYTSAAALALAVGDLARPDPSSTFHRP